MSLLRPAPLHPLPLPVRAHPRAVILSSLVTPALLRHRLHPLQPIRHPPLQGIREMQAKVVQPLLSSQQILNRRTLPSIQVLVRPAAS